MKTEIADRRKASVGERIIGAFLIVGGLLGILTAVLMGLRFAKQNETLRAFIQMISAGLFGWCIATGIALWRGSPGAVRVAQLLFALQVPAFTIARFSYEFSTFVSLRLMTGNTTRNIGGITSTLLPTGFISRGTSRPLSTTVETAVWLAFQ